MTFHMPRSLFALVALVGAWLWQPSATPAQTKDKANPTSKRAAPASRPAQARPAQSTKPAARATKAPASPKAPRASTALASKPKTKKRRDPMKGAIAMIENMLTRFLMDHGRDPDNPWLLAHSILALGKDLKLANGTLAIDRIASYIKFKKVGGKEVPYFPKGTNKQRIEPHPFMHLKTFLEVGVPLKRTFKVGKKKVSVKDLLQGAIYTFPANPKGKKDFSPMPWRLGLLYGHTPDQGWTWTNYEGNTVNFFKIIFKAFKYTNNQANFLRILRRNKVKVIPKRRQYIYSEPCGGFHLLQGVMRWMAHPQLLKYTKDVRKEHISLIFYRIDGELQLYISMLKKHAKQPAYRFIIMLQQLKFLGHALETLVKLNEWGIFNPTPAERRQIFKCLRLMLITVMIIDRMGFYKKIQALKTRALQFYLDLLGDSAHALHALKMISKNKLYLQP